MKMLRCTRPAPLRAHPQFSSVDFTEAGYGLSFDELSGRPMSKPDPERWHGTVVGIWHAGASIPKT
jgi:hypothetical protein